MKKIGWVVIIAIAIVIAIGIIAFSNNSDEQSASEILNKEGIESEGLPAGLESQETTTELPDEAKQGMDSGEQPPFLTGNVITGNVISEEINCPTGYPEKTGKFFAPGTKKNSWWPIIVSWDEELLNLNQNDVGKISRLEFENGDVLCRKISMVREELLWKGRWLKVFNIEQDNIRIWASGTMKVYPETELPEPEPTPEPELRLPSTILAFGDSITVGLGANRWESYPSVLARLLGEEVRVFNSGVTGETTTVGKFRLEGIINKYGVPDMVIILEGGNDFLARQSLATTKSNLKRMIEFSESKGSQVVLIGVPWSGLPSASLYGELADEFGLIYDGTLFASLFGNPDMRSEGNHLNAEGYSKLAEGIYELLKESGYQTA